MNLIQRLIFSLTNMNEIVYPKEGLMFFAEEFLVEPGETVEEKLRLREDKDYCLIGYIKGDYFFDIFKRKKYYYAFGCLFSEDGRRFSKVSIEERELGLYCEDVDEFICQPSYKNVSNPPITIINARTFYNKKLAKIFKAPNNTNYRLSELEKIKDKLNYNAYRYILSLIDINKWLQTLNERGYH